MTAQASASQPLTSLFTGRPSRRASISLTPLIDVVFILLIFFMLATSFVDDRAIEVGAPAAKLGGASLEGALLVELRQDGLRLAGERLTALQLLGRLQEHADRNPAQRVLIRPAPDVSLQDAVTLLDRVTASGRSHVSFVRA